MEPEWAASSGQKQWWPAAWEMSGTHVKSLPLHWPCSNGGSSWLWCPGGSWWPRRQWRPRNPQMQWRDNHPGSESGGRPWSSPQWGRRVGHPRLQGAPDTQPVENLQHRTQERWGAGGDWVEWRVPHHSPPPKRSWVLLLSFYVSNILLTFFTLLNNPSIKYFIPVFKVVEITAQRV